VPKTYPLEVRERALLQLVLSGSAPQAQRQLKELGIEIPERTLAAWKNSYAERIAEIAEIETRRVAQVMAAEAESVIRKSAALEHKLLDRLESVADELPAKEVANALRNVSTTKGINAQRIADPIRGRATAIVQHRGAGEITEELFNRMRRLGIVDGEAEEITDDLPGLPPGDA
jgi:hypothetical protein